MSVQTELYLFGLRSGSLDVLKSPAKQGILALDYDWRDQKAFWVSGDSKAIRWSSLDQKSTGVLVKGKCKGLLLIPFKKNKRLP